MSNYLSDRTNLIDASGIRKVFALAETMKDPVNFSIGQPDFDVPDELKFEAIKAIKSGANSYSQTAGLSELINKINKLAAVQFGWKNPCSIICSGVSGAILLAFMATINPGDEVIIPDPYFVIYKHIINMLGGKCVFVDTYPDFDYAANKIEKAVTSKTKIIVVNSPANPTGKVFSSQQLKSIAKVAAGHDILVMSDEIYNLFSYDGPCDSIAGYYDKTLLMRGFSKAYAMTGWRLAYVSANESLKPLLEAMTKIQQYTFVCAPTPFQKAAIKALDYDMSGYAAEYRVKRDLIYEGLRDKFELIKPGGAFYAFVKAPAKYPCASAFVETAIKNNVLIIPGSVFSQKDTHFRISYATSNEKIKRGIDILNSLA